MSSDVSVSVRFYPPPEDLRRYFTTFYHTVITTPDDAPVHDALHPEWAGLRFFAGGSPVSEIEGCPRLTGAHFVASGPTTRATRFTLGSTRLWGVGLLPLGWARFVRQSAADLANQVVDGESHTSFARFAPLARRLCAQPGDAQAELAQIIAFFRNLPKVREGDEARIQAIHAAVVDPTISSVSELVEHVGTSQRTIERLTARHFGFSPKQLLRRQRFMRSLAQFMLDPSLKWIGAMDWTYHDQAQFVRDFHDFMGQTPREYAATPHPILEHFIRERARVHGAPVQTMDSPDGAEPEASASAA